MIGLDQVWGMMNHIRKCEEITSWPEIWWQDAVYHEVDLYSKWPRSSNVHIFWSQPDEGHVVLWTYCAHGLAPIWHKDIYSNHDGLGLPVHIKDNVMRYVSLHWLNDLVSDRNKLLVPWPIVDRLGLMYVFNCMSRHCLSDICILISWHGNTFRIAGFLWGKFTSHRWITNRLDSLNKRTVVRNCYAFFVVRLNKLLNKYSSCRCLEAPSHSYDVSHDIGIFRWGSYVPEQTL